MSNSTAREAIEKLSSAINAAPAGADSPPCSLDVEVLG
jgi:hypothetical protein